MAGKNNKKRGNYFSDNIERFGEGFLQRFDAKKLRSDAKRVFSDIAFGNIDFDKYWSYFTEPMFINALIDAANTKLMIHGVSYNAIKAQEQYGVDPDMMMVEISLNYHHIRIYTILLLSFDCII